jgi:hypothetical protein
MEKTTEELHCLFIVSNLKLTVAVTRARNRLPMTLQRTKQIKSQFSAFVWVCKTCFYSAQKHLLYMNQDGGCRNPLLLP